MKMKSILLMMLSLCLLVCLCACGSDNPTSNKKDEIPSTSTPISDSADPTNPTDPTDPIVDPTDPIVDPTDPSNDAPTTEPSQTQPTQPVDGKANYTVIVTDEAGNPIPGAFVQLCLESCIPCMTNAQGVASYPNMPVADYKVSFITVPDGYQLPTENFYFEKDSYEMTLVLKATN